MGGKARELKHRISVWSVIRGQLCKGHGDSAGSWQPRDKLGTGGQQAELRKESGVRIQEEKNIKNVLSFWLQATDYLGFCDLNYLNNGPRTARYALCDKRFC